MEETGTGGGKGASGCAGCGKALAIGCAVVLGLGLLAAVGVAMNWRVIKESDWFRGIAEMAAGAKTEFGRMMELREKLDVDYPADSIEIGTSAHSGSDGSTKTLTVTFVNPRFEPPGVGDDALRPLAEDIARLYPEIERYDFIQISLRRRVTTGVTVSSAIDVTYPVSDLLGPGLQVEGREEESQSGGNAESDKENPPPY